MAPKTSLALAALLVAVVVAAGQVPRGAAALGPSPVNSSVLISGVVPCAAGNSINAATAPVFANAALQLVCGSKVVAGATADGNGAFLFSLVSVSQKLLSAVLMSNQCRVVVVTPLVACDKSLVAATGTLTAPLKLLGIDTGSGSGGGGLDLGGIIGLIGQIVGGLIGGILNLGTQSFSLV